MNKDKIELPPLPCKRAGEHYSSTIVVTLEEAEDAIYAAIEADRKQRHLKERAQLNQEWAALKDMQAQYEADGKRRGEPVAEIKIEPDYWSRGHFYRGERKEAKPMKGFYDLPVGAKLYAYPQPAELTAMQRQMLRNVAHEQNQRAREKGDYHDQVADLLTSIALDPQPTHPAIKDSLTTAEPVKVPILYIQSNHINCAQRMGPFMARVSGRQEQPDWKPLFAAPVAAQPSVPEPCTDMRLHERYIAGWNACRAAMFHATPPAAEQAQQDADKVDAERFRWLTDDHADRNDRSECNSILRRMPSMSYSAACADIDRAMQQEPK